MMAIDLRKQCGKRKKRRECFICCEHAEITQAYHAYPLSSAKYLLCLKGAPRLIDIKKATTREQIKELSTRKGVERSTCGNRRSVYASGYKLIKCHDTAREVHAALLLIRNLDDV